MRERGERMTSESRPDARPFPTGVQLQHALRPDALSPGLRSPGQTANAHSCPFLRNLCEDWDSREAIVPALRWDEAGEDGGLAAPPTGPSDRRSRPRLNGSALTTREFESPPPASLAAGLMFHKLAALLFIEKLKLIF
ncbi:hypothetical protein AAFF_G00389940 [Aldrovandia affinis]|uniref:Uncharacterized protein n=1 Tax=Aldrovandia affinis TaxID=143900 RepID=A0AAD7WL93_9TELE|nr:hypothetical protein AAFF_G00389940 [Aldrovandia affinis]